MQIASMLKRSQMKRGDEEGNAGILIPTLKDHPSSKRLHLFKAVGGKLGTGVPDSTGVLKKWPDQGYICKPFHTSWGMRKEVQDSSEF